MFQKIIIPTMALMLFPVFAAWTQINEGVIHYELRMDMHRNIPADREDMKAMIPQFRTVDFELYFKQTERLYKAKEEIVVPGQGGGRGRGFGMRMPRSETWVNTGAMERVVYQEFMGRNFLITDTINLGPWRLGSEYMDILGYRCQMAWYIDTITNEEITAWFTIGLQPFMGPDKYSTLPGTILALDVNNGERVWVARKVEEKAIRSDDLRKPSRGERITRQEYDKLMQEQMDRLRQGGGFRF
jgi:GLPGLI family protein